MPSSGRPSWIRISPKARRTAPAAPPTAPGRPA
jgi:hypothetical protein